MRRLPKRFFKKTETLAPEIDAERKDELSLFQRHAGIKFKNAELLNLAFCHRSFANERGGGIGNNERLEFLGDSVLGLAVAEYLYQELPDRPEGDLAKIKSFVVSEASLSEIARGLRVDNFILIGKGEEYSGGRAKKAILADAFEAIIGAFFLDSGFREARRFVLTFLVPEIEKVLENRHEKDYKTLLQEYAQKTFRSYPRYVLNKKTGPDHDRLFWMQVEVGGRSYGPGKGSNKKQAEQAAAAIAYEALTSGGGQPREPRRRKPRSQKS
ncbi:MAG: ribonuclease III [Spirochaetota bacterium]